MKYLWMGIILAMAGYYLAYSPASIFNAGKDPGADPGQGTYSGLIDQAESLAEQANEKSAKLDAMQGMEPESADKIQVELDALIEQLSDSDPELRTVAALTLKSNRYSPHAKRALPILTQLAREDPDPDVRIVARLTVKQIRWATARKGH